MEDRSKDKKEVKDLKDGIEKETERLPGDIHFHLKELRKASGRTLEDTAKLFGVSLSKYKQMENQESQAIDDKLIIKACQLYKVSSDYLLGFTTIEYPTGPYIEYLRLSEKSLRKLTEKSFDREVFNRLIEHHSFKYLMWSVSSFVHDRISDGYRNRNEILAGGILAMKAGRKSFPEMSEEIEQDQFIVQDMMELQPDQADTGRIVKTMQKVLQDVRKDIRMNRNNPVLLTRNEIRDMILSFRKRRQNGERFSFVSCMKAVVKYVFKKVPMFGIKESGKDNEIVISIPETPDQIIAGGRTMADSLIKMTSSKEALPTETGNR